MTQTSVEKNGKLKKTIHKKNLAILCDLFWDGENVTLTDGES